MRELLWQIYNDGSISDENIGSRVFWFENHPILRRAEPDPSESSPDSKPVIKLLPSPRLLSSHLPYDVIPKGKDDTTTCKYIYIARNPKDVAVSHYHFLLFFPEMGEFTCDLCLKLFLQGRRKYMKDVCAKIFQPIEFFKFLLQSENEILLSEMPTKLGSSSSFQR